jgi:hypothetical protein
MAARSGPGDLLELQEDDQLARLVKDWNFQRARILKLLSSPGSSLPSIILLLLLVVLFICWPSFGATPFVSPNLQ